MKNRNSNIIVLLISIIIIESLILVPKGLSIDNVKYIITTILLGWAAFCDIRTKLIPDICWILMGITGVINFLLPTDNSITDILFGGLTILIILGSISLFSHGTMGFGDVKLLSSMGLVLGFAEIWTILFYAAILSSIIGIIFVAVKKAKIKEKLAFAPFIFIAMFINILI